MHNNEFKKFILKTVNILCGILPVSFWLLIIYGFDEPCIAGITVISAVIHEAGHLFYAYSRGLSPTLRSTSLGFRIRRGRAVGYTEELMLYAFGPIFNILAAIIALLSLWLGSEYAICFALINVATAISNLLPIKSRDGYGIIRVILEMQAAPPFARRMLDALSFGIIAFLTLLSLYLMQKCDGGYWIFAVFLISLVSEMERGLREVNFEH